MSGHEYVWRTTRFSNHTRALGCLGLDSTATLHPMVVEVVMEHIENQLLYEAVQKLLNSI